MTTKPPEARDCDKKAEGVTDRGAAGSEEKGGPDGLLSASGRAEGLPRPTGAAKPHRQDGSFKPDDTAGSSEEKAARRVPKVGDVVEVIAWAGQWARATVSKVPEAYERGRREATAEIVAHIRRKADSTLRGVADEIERGAGE